MHNPNANTLSLPDIKVQSLYQDSQKNLWICTSRQGVYRLAPDGSILNFRNLPDNTNSLSNNDVRCAIEDDLGNLWFGTFYGLNKYNPSTQVWENHVHQNNISHSLSHSSVFALYKDTQGGIWIGTYFGGVNYYNPTDDHTSYYEANPDMPHALSFPVVGKMQEDAEHNLWICTEGGGLNFLDRQTRQFTRYVHNKGGLSGIGHNNLKCIWLRKETGQLYIGTHTGGLTIFDTRKKTAHTLKIAPTKPTLYPAM